MVIRRRRAGLIGLRLRDFGRDRIAKYGANTETVNRSESETPPPAWVRGVEDPLVWRDPIVPASAPAVSAMPPGPAPESGPELESEPPSAIPADLLAIMRMHEAKESEDPSYDRVTVPPARPASARSRRGSEPSERSIQRAEADSDSIDESSVRQLPRRRRGAVQDVTPVLTGLPLPTEPEDSEAGAMIDPAASVTNAPRVQAETRQPEFDAPPVVPASPPAPVMRQEQTPPAAPIRETATPADMPTLREFETSRVDSPVVPRASARSESEAPTTPMPANQPPVVPPVSDSESLWRTAVDMPAPRPPADVESVSDSGKTAQSAAPTPDPTSGEEAPARPSGFWGAVKDAIQRTITPAPKPPAAPTSQSQPDSAPQSENRPVEASGARSQIPAPPSVPSQQEDPGTPRQSGGSTPASGVPAPVSGVPAPASGESTPASDIPMPKPASAGSAPVPPVNRKPDAPTSTPPSQAQVTPPASGGSTPASGGSTPASGGSTPASGGSTPASGVPAPATDMSITPKPTSADAAPVSPVTRKPDASEPTPPSQTRATPPTQSFEAAQTQIHRAPQVPSQGSAADVPPASPRAPQPPAEDLIFDEPLDRGTPSQPVSASQPEDLNIPPRGGQTPPTQRQNIPPAPSSTSAETRPTPRVTPPAVPPMPASPASPIDSGSDNTGGTPISNAVNSVPRGASPLPPRTPPTSAAVPPDFAPPTILDDFDEGATERIAPVSPPVGDVPPAPRTPDIQRTVAPAAPPASPRNRARSSQIEYVSQPTGSIPPLPKGVAEDDAVDSDDQRPDLYEALVSAGVINPRSPSAPPSRINRKPEAPAPPSPTPRTQSGSGTPPPPNAAAGLLDILGLPTDTPVSGMNEVFGGGSDDGGTPPPTGRAIPAPEPAAPNPPQIMRVESAGSAPAEGDAGSEEGGSPDPQQVEKLARAVYKVLRDKLRSENERRP